MSLPKHKAEQKPSLIRFLAVNAGIGGATGCAAAGMLLATDAGGLATLLVEANSIIAGSALLFGGFALTFASLAMGSAIMLLPKK